MTKEEAIELVELAFYHWEGEWDCGEDWSKQHEACQMAIDALKRDDPEVEFQKRLERSKCCGYTLKELLMFADACRRQGITEEHLHIFWKNVEGAYNYIMQIIKEGITKSIERTLS